MSYLVIFVNMRNSYSITFIHIGLSEFHGCMVWIFREYMGYTREFYDLSIICRYLCYDVLMKLGKINVCRAVIIFSSFHYAIRSLYKYLMECFIPESTEMKIA